MAMGKPSSSHASTYDVFISSRWEDTRYGFAGHLYTALTDKGICTFIDDEELQRTEEITPELIKAIQGSSIAIIVLSKHYATSSFCLDELTTIIHCAQNRGLLVIPVFYKVDPSDVRHLRGTYEDALTEHENRSPEKLQKWKEALRKVADLSGYHFKQGDGYEYKFIESIVDLVSEKINYPARLPVADHPVGLGSQVAQVMKLLDVESDDVVHMVGIHGMRGVGKSTLARAVYNILTAHRFDGFCYLENVREESQKHGLRHLQNVLLREILRDKKINVTSVGHGAFMIAQRLQRKKVLLLIDDVDGLKQLEAIVGSTEWFGPGSRVIITTRDQQLLACHQVKRIYKVKTLKFDEARQLLTWKAFRKEKADPTYEEVLKRVLTYASGHPWALEVIGSKLFGKSIEIWESHLQILKNSIPKFDRCKSLKQIGGMPGLENLEKFHRLNVAWRKLDDDFFSRTSFTRFAHVRYLDLSRNNFTFLPECIKEFQALHTLDVSDCKHLQEIRGVPPNLKQFYARNCKSLTDLTTRMFINQELYEAGMKECFLPRACIPKWFDYQSTEPSISFWFRNKFPRKILCFLVALVEDEILSNFPAPIVFINGKVHEVRFDSDQNTVRMEMDHTYLFELHLRYDMFEVPLENEWNHVEVTYAGVTETSIVKASGIHVVKQESINEDIRYVSPYEIKPFSYDVFLSFRGSDTLHGFTGYLHKALNESGIHTYIDDKELQREEKIAPEIVKAIEESRIAIIVLSINYASSSFCLDELASILDCPRKRMLVLPVFYNVDPSHVRHQTGSYGEALVEHEKGFKHNMETLQKWKTALHQVADLPGFYFKQGDGYEYEFIGRIVERVSSEINHTPLVGYPVGLESQVQNVRELLDVGCDDVLMIGIYGIGGVGKSTLTRKVYNLIADHFDASCFIENVREKSQKHGLQHLQSILLSKILGEKDITLTSVQQGISMIQRRLQQKKVLLILDDADRHEQLKAVVGRPEWFGPGSRVIITTRDEQLLASHGVKSTYEMEKMRENDAFQLLKWKAFKAEEIDPRYEKLLVLAVTYASGLPLALEIIGSNLLGKSVEEWESAIRQFEESPNDPIQVIFKASFDALGEKTRSIFLDIACCFKGYELAEIQDVLHAHYGHSVKNHIDALVDKSLVKLSHGTEPCYDTITLHDLIEDMAKEIEQQESKEPAKRRRLWLLEDIREVLGSNTGTRKTEIICLDFPILDKEKIVVWDGKAFQNMQNLKTIIIRNLNFSKGPEYLPNSLRVLEWWRYPSHCLPSDFHPKDLAICKLPYIHILPTELTDLLKNFPKLKVLEFSSAVV